MYNDNTKGRAYKRSARKLFVKITVHGKIWSGYFAFIANAIKIITM